MGKEKRARGAQPESLRQAMIRRVRREWVGKWVWFDPGDHNGDPVGIEKGVVTLVNALGEVYISYSFDERGCYTLPVCTVDDISQVLMLVVEK
jgi:hypothetical protein